MIQDELEKEAESQNFPVKLVSKSAKVSFNRKLKTDVVPFMAKDKQEIIYKKFDKLFNIK